MSFLPSLFRFHSIAAAAAVAVDIYLSGNSFFLGQRPAQFPPQMETDKKSLKRKEGAHVAALKRELHKRNGGMGGGGDGDQTVKLH